MKIAHFAIFSPNASGQYATVKDLILAERQVGLDAQFVDYGVNGKSENRVGLKDGDVETVPMEWAFEEADIIVRHTVVPPRAFKKPVLFALHGRPENSFRLEQYNITPVISLLMENAANKKYSGYFTFWKEHLYTLSWVVPNVKVHYIPPPVDLNEYNTHGPKHDFQRNGSPNIVITDRWREDQTPYNIVYAAQYFKDHYAPDTKLHIYGVPSKNTCINYLQPLQRVGLIGETYPLVHGLDKIYRSADMLLTPNIIATRVVREAMASGLPFVAPVGCKYTPYTAEPRKTEDFAAAINDCYQNLGKDLILDTRKQAEKWFGLEKTGLAVKAMCEEILDVGVKFNGMSINYDDWITLLKIIKGRNLLSVVEFGSGISTKLFKDAGLKVTSYETEQQRAGAGIELWDGKIAPVLNGNFDMAFIDGPQGSENREPSYKAVADSSIPLVACHDAHREGDREWIKKYFGSWKVIADEPNTLRVLERV